MLRTLTELRYSNRFHESQCSNDNKKYLMPKTEQNHKKQTTHMHMAYALRQIINLSSVRKSTLVTLSVENELVLLEMYCLLSEVTRGPKTLGFKLNHSMDSPRYSHKYSPFFSFDREEQPFKLHNSKFSFTIHCVPLV